MRDLSHNEILAVTGGTLSLSLSLNLFKCAPKPSKLSCLTGLLALLKTSCAPKPVCAPKPSCGPVTPPPAPEPEPEIG